MFRMAKRVPWFNRNIEKSRLLAALDDVRHLCCSLERLMACARRRSSFALLEKIKRTIDDYAENETGYRQYFWDQPHSAGGKHS